MNYKSRFAKSMAIKRHTDALLISFRKTKIPKLEASSTQLFSHGSDTETVRNTAGCLEKNSLESATINTNVIYRNSDNSSSSSLSDCDNSSSSDDESNIKIDSEDTYSHTDSINADIRSWAIKFKVNHNQLNNLLPILRKYGHKELPLSAKTILKTPKHIPIKTMTSIRETEGQYVHFGIENNIIKGLETMPNNAFVNNNIELIINIDGLPLNKSTSNQFWPILGAIFLKNRKLHPFPIGIFYGDSKPKDIEAYLSQFIEEINYLYMNGINHQNKLYSIKIKKICCDAPARAFIKCIIGHTGYYGCERCIEKGLYSNRKVVYTSLNAELRTHESFVEGKNKKHHIRISPLLKVHGLDIIHDIPLDYMHMACLGVMKRLLNCWIKNRSLSCALSHPIISSISQHIQDISKSVPCEFQRKPRGFKDLEKWKATEFRFFMLYAGPIVLKTYLPRKLYTNFLNFHAAMRIVCSETLIKNYGNQALVLIEKFCLRLVKLYGECMLVYNTHGIFHMINDAVREEISVDQYSCFPFESYLGRLLKLIRGPAKLLQQISCRLLEQFHDKSNVDPTDIEIHKKNSKIAFVKINGYKIYPSINKDCHILLPNKKIMCVDEIIEQESNLLFRGSIYLKSQPYYDLFTNCDLDFLEVNNLSTYKFTASISDLITKCIMINVNNSIIGIGMLHKE